MDCVYDCLACDVIYIEQCGYTKRNTFEEKNAIQKNIMNTGFTEHCLIHNHFIDTSSIKLLYSIEEIFV